MTTGTEIVDEFHRHNFFVQSMADEWLAKRIDEALHAAVAVEAAKWGRPAPIPEPVTVEIVRPTPNHDPLLEPISHAVKRLGPIKKQRANRK